MFVHICPAVTLQPNGFHKSFLKPFLFGDSYWSFPVLLFGYLSNSWLFLIFQLWGVPMLLTFAHLPQPVQYSHRLWYLDLYLYTVLSPILSGYILVISISTINSSSECTLEFLTKLCRLVFPYYIYVLWSVLIKDCGSCLSFIDTFLPREVYSCLNGVETCWNSLRKQIHAPWKCNALSPNMEIMLHILWPDRNSAKTLTILSNSPTGIPFPNTLKH